MNLPSVQLAQAADELTQRLADLGSEERAAWDRDYLHSEMTHLGVPLPELRRAVSAVRRALPPLTRDDVVALAGLLWRGTVYDHRQAAVQLLAQQARLLTPADLPTLEAMLRAARTWALVDTLAVHVAGRITLQHREAVGAVIDGWAGDEDFWIRRSALLVLLPGIRADTPDLERLDRYAEAMVGESEFFVRKAIGWVLRETSRSDDRFVTAWVEARIDRVSGVTLREAVRHLPAADRDRLTRAYRQAHGR
ncbi:3-methyladenine DNA glycosylase AlkD [Streptacidiphilus sp. MAP12-20]|uniref:DNA alkylation repair protein n=1 Tax=Streptacidiphilus sp. MAP12-20 TaxID=3156299 RepID=UPI003512180E